MAARGRFLALSRATGKRVIEKRRRLRLEPLEDRRLLSVATDPAPLAAIDPSTTVVATNQNAGRAIDLVSSDQWGCCGNDRSISSRITADGRYVVFTSSASNLVSDDYNGYRDVFVKDMLTGLVTYASTNSRGEYARGDSFNPSISDDGRYVLFSSSAPDLTSDYVYNWGYSCIYLKDLFTSGITRLTSVAQGSGPAPWEVSSEPVISGDGNWAVYTTYRWLNSSPGGVRSLYLENLQTHAETRVTSSGDSFSYSPSISADGSYIAYRTGPLDSAKVVSASGRYLTYASAGSIYVEDLVSGTVTCQVSGNGDSYYPSISADGRLLAFASRADNLVAGDTNNKADVFLKDTVTGTIVLLSVSASGSQGNGDSMSPMISADGSSVVFESSASNLHPSDTNTSSDIFRVSLASAASATSIVASGPSVYGQQATFTAQVSGAAGMPSGTVCFKAGAEVLGTATLDANGQATFTTSLLSAGHHDVVAIYGGNAEYQGSVSDVVAQDVSPAVLTITADSKTKVYGTILPALTASYSGFVNGDTVAGLYALPTLSTTATASSPPGVYPIIASGATSSDYAITYVAGILTIEAPAPAATTTSVVASASPSVYGQSATFTATVAADGSTPTGTVNFMDGSTVLSTATLDGSGQATYTTSLLVAGSHTITAVYAGNVDYVGSASDGLTQTVTPAPLTIYALSQTKVYGATLPTLAATYYDGFVNGDTVANLATLPTLSTTATASSPVGSYPINVSGAASSNYAISYVPGTLIVSRAALTITADSKTKVYGAGLPTLTASYSGFVLGETAATLTTLPTLSTTATTASPVGSYAITASGAASSNYTFTYVTGELSITPAALTITADSKTKVYGAAVPELTASYSGFVNGDTVAGLYALPTLSTTATASSPPGVYPIIASGATSSDYAITYVAGILTIEAPAPAATTTSVVASASPSVYGQSATFTATVAADGSTPTGTVNFMDGSTVLSTATLDGSGQATYTTSLLVAGSHTITAVYAGDTGFDGSTSDGLTQTVTPAPLTITADNKTKTYGAALPTLTASYSGFVLGETAANLTALPTLSTTATASSPVGVYPITVSGATSSNYDITYVAGTLTIEAASAAATATSVIASANTSIYGDLVVFTATVTSDSGTPRGTVTFKEGDAVLWTSILDENGQAFFGIDILGGGSHTITAVYSGNADYVGSTSAGITQTIVPAPLTITANSLTITQGDALPTLTASYSGFVNDERPWDLTTLPTLSTTATTTSPVGSYPITASGAASPNYAITYVAGTLTINADNEGSISGVVWHDDNGNGVKDSGESDWIGLLEGELTVFLDANNNDVLDSGETTTQTGFIDGNYSFSGLAAGDYCVRIVAPSGMTIATPSAGYYSVTVANGQSITGKDFAFAPVPPAPIAGRVWHDSNLNGGWDAGELEWIGSTDGQLTVYLDTNNNGVLDSGETYTLTGWSDGCYSFGGLTYGTYTVRLVTPAGSVVSAPAAGCYSVTLAPGVVPTMLDFGLATWGSIGGLVWTDSNGNGLLDGEGGYTEQGREGVTVYIDTNQNDTLDAGEYTTTTTSDGAYTLEYLPAGTYRVRIVMPAGMNQSIPTAGYYSVTLADGQSVSGKDFGVCWTVPVSAKITAVYAKGTSWTSEFLNYLAIAGVGDATLGYKLSVGANQLKSIPWTNVDTISVVFDQGVTIAADDAILVGVNTAYYLTSFSYDTVTHVASWTKLSGSFDKDRLLLHISGAPDGVRGNLEGGLLDGDWIDGQSTQSGDGLTGGDFNFRFNVLPGDVNQNGLVTSSDVVLTRNALGSTCLGGGLYSIYKDVSANAAINTVDLIRVRNAQATALPSANPIVPVGLALPGEQGLMVADSTQTSASGVTTVVAAVATANPIGPPPAVSRSVASSAFRPGSQELLRMKVAWDAAVREVSNDWIEELSGFRADKAFANLHRRPTTAVRR